MFVSDSRIFPARKMKLSVACADGRRITLELDPESTVDKVKISVLQQMASAGGVKTGGTASWTATLPDDCVKQSIYLKLVHVSTCKSLVDDKSLRDQGVADDDELVLINRRLPSAASFTSIAKGEDGENQTPTADMIAQATQTVPIMHSTREPGNLPTVDCSAPNLPAARRVHHAELKDEVLSFQKELRKILISLIDVAQKLLCLNPEAAKIFSQVEELAEEEDESPPIRNSVSRRIDDGALAQLKDMGFPENRARKALALNRNVMEAMDWLLQHENDLDLDEPLPEVTRVQDHNDNNQSLSEAPGPDVADSANLPTNKSANSPAHAASSKVSNILKSFKAFKRKEFKPNQKAFQTLCEMGFAEKDVIDALRINGNREKAACDWLLSGEHYDIKEEECGLDPDSPLYKAIMSNHIVQLGLTNPRSLTAFMNMLENPHNTQRWLTDQDTGRMLIQISRIYYAERNVSMT